MKETNKSQHRNKNYITPEEGAGAHLKGGPHFSTTSQGGPHFSTTSQAH
jgi:hypothetical protein